MLLDEFKESFKQFIEKDGMEQLCIASEVNFKWQLKGGHPDDDEEERKRIKQMAEEVYERSCNFSIFQSGVMFKLHAIHNLKDKTINIISFEAKAKQSKDSPMTIREEALTN